MPNNKIIDLDRLSRFKDNYDNALETGQIVPSKALVAQEIETISPESGDTQETPFILQGTGTANGTSSVDTGTVGKHIQKQGSVYCVNQLVNPDNLRTDGITGLTITKSNGVLTLNGTINSGDNVTLMYKDIKEISSHKYLIKFGQKLPVHTRFVVSNSNNNYHFVGDYAVPVESVLATASTSGSSFGCFIQANDTVTFSNFKITYQVIDLTQWFNGNIPQDILDHPDHFSWYHNYGDYIAYNTGTLTSGNGRYLVNTGYNQFDGEWTKTLSDTLFTFTNFIRVVAGQTYTAETPDMAYQAMYFNCYDASFNYIGRPTLTVIDSSSRKGVIPDNCRYVKVEIYNGNGITQGQFSLHLTYDASRTGYEPYEQPKVYDTGTEELLSTGVKLSVSGEREDIYDYKEPNGLITRRVAKVDLGTLSWTKYGSNQGVYRSSAITDMENTTVSTPTNHHRLACVYPEDTNDNAFLGSYECIAKELNRLIISIPSATDLTSLLAKLNGKMVNYPLVTPTTEQGTPYSENIEINDFGTMGWYSSYTNYTTNTFANVPQGCKIFYPAWYVGFVDTLGQRADIDWNANNVVSQTELGASEDDRDKVDNQIIANLGGILRHMISGVDFNNTDVVDLGTLNWNDYNSTRGMFTSNGTISGAVGSSDNNVASNMVGSIYKSNTANICYNGLVGGGADKQIAITGTGQVYIIDSAMSGKTGAQIKEMLKGILLAYEKAS